MAFRSVALLLVLIGLPLLLAGVSAQTLDRASFDALRSADLRLATIAYRLTTANVTLCHDVAPTPGFALQAADQYPPNLRLALRAVFGFETPVSIEAVVPGSVAARAGVTANVSIAAVDGQGIVADPAGQNVATSATRDAVWALIANQPPAAPLTLSLIDGGQRRDVTLGASPGCRSRFETVTGRGLSAIADGTVVQIGIPFFERFDDDDIAVVVAHELAHNILRHRIRLDAARVARGVLSEFGRNGRLLRQSENDADLLGMYLMRNAGYDPEIAVRFWLRHGGEISGGLFRSRTHFSASRRAASLQAEIDRIPADAPIPYQPPILATRDQPM